MSEIAIELGYVLFIVLLGYLLLDPHTAVRPLAEPVLRERQVPAPRLLQPNYQQQRLPV
jgi:hypothetical protein